MTEPIDVGGAAAELLRTSEAGGRVVRGGVYRGLGYGVGIVVGIATAALLLNYFSIEEFGVYATVGAILGIVAGVTDAGLTTVGGREVAVASPDERKQVLQHLLFLRVVASVAGVLVAIGFTVVAGYRAEAVWGTVIGGGALVLLSAQSMLTVPMWVELRILSLTAVEVLRNVLTLVGVAVAVAVGASLPAFFGVQVAVALVLLPITAWLARIGMRRGRALRRELLDRLIRESLPLAVAVAMGVVYVRVLLVLVSLLASERETGLFGTSFRIFEMLLILPGVVLAVALPLLSVAGAENIERLRYGLQRMTEAALLFSAILAVGVGILAEPAIRLIGTDEYADAAPVLRVQAIALVPLFLGQGWPLGLVAVRAQKALVVANGVALAVVLALGVAFVPAYGAAGASWAAVAAETVLALLLWRALSRAGGGVAPRLGFAGEVALAAAVAGGAGWLLRDLPLVAAAAALLVFAATALATRAVPADVAHAFRPRSRRERT